MNSKQGKSRRARFMRAIKSTAAIAVSIAAPVAMAAPAEAAAPASTQSAAYTVAHGETLSGIAAHCRTTVPALMSANRDRIEDQDVIFNRQTIRIPKRTTRTWKVREGDTLSQIGRCTGEPWGKLAERNGVTDPRALHIGRRLELAPSRKRGDEGGAKPKAPKAETPKPKAPKAETPKPKAPKPTPKSTATDNGFNASWFGLGIAVGFVLALLAVVLRRRLGRDRPTGAKAARGERPWLALIALSLAAFISSVDVLIVNAGLEEIAVDLRTGIDQLTWVVSGFTLALGSWPLAAAALGDRIGRRRLILCGLFVFAAASGVAAAAQTASTLIAARYAMGFGLGIVVPNAVGTIRTMFPAERLGRALAIWSIAGGLGIVTGPLVGGFLLRHFDWGSIFLVNVPFAVAAWIGGWLSIPKQPQTERARRLDPLGIALAVLGVSALMWAIIEGPERGWGSAVILAAFAAFAVLTAAWVAWERRAREPMVQLGWFRDGAVSGAVVALACSYAALLGATFLVTVWMQAVQGWDALETGIRLLPVAASLLVAVPVATWLSGRFGARWVIGGGLVMIAVGVAVFSRTSTGAEYPLVVLTLCLGGAGLGATLSPSQVLIVGRLAAARAAIASALGDTARYVGGAIGLALSASLFSTGYQEEVEPVLSKAPLNRLPGEALAAAGDSVFGAAQVADRTGAALGELLREDVVVGGYSAGLGTPLVVGVCVALAGALLAIRMIPGRGRPSGPHEVPIALASESNPDAGRKAAVTRLLLERIERAAMGLDAISAVGNVRVWFNGDSLSAFVPIEVERSKDPRAVARACAYLVAKQVPELGEVFVGEVDMRA